MGNPEDLGRYRLKRLLGRGVFGEMWAADDRALPGVKVVVKIMHAADDELTLARHHFAREAEIAMILRHPHFVVVHDCGEAAGTSYMVMEHVEGESLNKAMVDPKTTTVEKLRWIRQIASALSALHEAGIAHRDLKPQNVIIRPDRSACLVDLGIAKWIRFELSHETPESKPKSPSAYVPPETTADDIYDELSDQWAWGVIAYELLTGSPPEEDGSSLTGRAAAPPRVLAAIDRARAPERSERFVTMDEVVDELAERERRPAALEEATAPPPAPPNVRVEAALAAPNKPKRAPLALVGVVIVVAAIGAIIVAALR